MSYGLGRDTEEAMARLVDEALREDVGDGDVTTEWTVPAGRRDRAVVVAKEPLVVAGLACVAETFLRLDSGVQVTLTAADGDRVVEEDVLARLQGRTRSILTGERTALNFLGRLSGIATLTCRFVDAVAGTGARIVDTRKTTPGWRLLEKAAVRAGGGTNHRMGLHDMVLVKDNHTDAAGGVDAAARAALEKNTLGLPVEVEVRSLEELEEVLPVGVDRILLDNMHPGTLAEAVRRTREWAAAGPGTEGRRPVLEASGNVTLGTVRSVAETGVDLVSVGALTHSAPGADVSLRIVGG